MDNNPAEKSEAVEHINLTQNVAGQIHALVNRYSRGMDVYTDPIVDAEKGEVSFTVVKDYATGDAEDRGPAFFEVTVKLTQFA